MSNKTGGSAFPTNYFSDSLVSPSEILPSEGMTLRDYFAAKAMQEYVGANTQEQGARKAYEWADAMLKARGND
jgi:hypothetical protein